MAIRNTLHVEVVTAEREIYNGEADMVVARGTEGVLGILPRHAALLTTLAIGEMRIKLGDAQEPLFVAGGFLEGRETVKEAAGNEQRLLGITEFNTHFADSQRCKQCRV